MPSYVTMYYTNTTDYNKYLTIEGVCALGVYEKYYSRENKWVPPIGYTAQDAYLFRVTCLFLEGRKA